MSVVVFSGTATVQSPWGRSTFVAMASEALARARDRIRWAVGRPLTSAVLSPVVGNILRPDGA